MVLYAEIVVASRNVVLLACKSFSNPVGVPCEVGLRVIRHEQHVKVTIPYSVYLGKDSDGNNSYYDELHQRSFAIKKLDNIEDGLMIVHPSFNLIDDELAKVIEEKFNETG